MQNVKLTDNWKFWYKSQTVSLFTSRVRVAGLDLQLWNSKSHKKSSRHGYLQVIGHLCAKFNMMEQSIFIQNY